jgi:hypothetical protein
MKTLRSRAATAIQAAPYRACGASHSVAFLDSILIFILFWVVGFAILGLLFQRDDLIRTALISPAAGSVFVAYLCYVLSRLGFAIGTVALPLAIGLLAGSVFVIFWRRPPLPGWRGAPYLAIVLLSFLASGWPLLIDGFSWLASLNPDAPNYILNADRFMREGYVAFPDAQTWISQSNRSDYYVTYVLRGERPGPFLLLAFVSSASGLDTPAAYMPLTVALHIAALSAATALVRTPDRIARILCGGLLAVCALSTVGVTLQLIAQEFGIACLALNCVLLLAPFYRLAPLALARRGALTASTLAGFLTVYPEMVPFLVLSALLFHLITIREFLAHWRRALMACAIIGFGAGVLIAPDVLHFFHFLFTQADSATSAGRKLATAFPYILLPSGLGVLWGLRAFSPGSMAPVAEEAAIWIGMLLTISTVFASIWLAFRREPCAVIVLVMAMLGIPLFLGDTGFGTFKLAMYIQPFLMATVVIATCRLLGVAR